MFLKDITVIETSPCLAEKDLFKGITMASVDLTELLPYLNAVVEKPNYLPNSNSLLFKNGIIRFTLKGNNINVAKFANITELYELLDWVKELINTTYENRERIEPNHKGQKIVPTLKIYSLLPKQNCKKCGEQSCMAFAAKLNKLEAEVDDCPLFRENEFKELKNKLLREME